MTAASQAQREQPQRQSRIGKRPIKIPAGVKLNLSGRTVEVQGPHGKLSQQLPEQVELKREGDILRVQSTAAGRDGPRLQGLARALIGSMVKGAAEGYTRTLELVGTGYRAEVKGANITLLVGLSHPAVCPLPPDVQAEVPKESKGTVLILKSADKAVLGQLAATLRARRPPEPYGGKGVRFRGEQLRRKAGKAGKKAG